MRLPTREGWRRDAIRTASFELLEVSLDSFGRVVNGLCVPLRTALPGYSGFHRLVRE